MTPRGPDARYDDILTAAGYAREIVRRGRHEFDHDVVLRLAGERVVELLAEAVAGVVDHLEEAYPDYPWHEPIGMRNLIAHEYWRSDPELIWTALAEDVREVERMVQDVT